jgi:branched-chain amino acid transport system ATP-binding protein
MTAGASGASGDVLLDVANVAYSYRGIPAVQDISLAVSPGEVVAIVGPNGAGKTTLAKMIAGILTPARGTVSVGGEVLSGLRPSRVPARGVGIVLEGRHVFPGQSVRTNLELGAFWRRLKRAELEGEMRKAFDLFGDLERFADKPAAR